MINSNQFIIRMELKYCERCGGLWLRRESSGSIFCDPCEHAEKLMPMRRARGPRVGVQNDFELGAMIALGAAIGVSRATGTSVERSMA
jgi:hypothetical protein